MFKETIEYLGREVHGYTIRKYLIRLGAESDRVDIMNFIDEQAASTTFMLELDGDWLSRDEVKAAFLPPNEDDESIHYQKAWSEHGVHMALREGAFK